MAEAALKIDQQTTNKSEGSRHKIERTYSEELIIGICAPFGTHRGPVIDALKARLEDHYDYECEIIKLSEFIQRHSPPTMLANTSTKPTKFETLISKIKNGDALRERYGDAILAEHAVAKILQNRFPNTKSEDLYQVAIEDALAQQKLPESTYNSKRKCYIIDSIKHKEELLLFKTVYRELFYQFSIFTPYEERFRLLKRTTLINEEIEELIKQDAGDGKKHGQNVRGTFLMGDFFIRVSEETVTHAINSIERFLHLIFDTKIITPTIDETAMYQAKAAGSNSACLSRQVGASVTDEKGQLLSIGWNDVPKVNGGLYQDGVTALKDDKRCVNINYQGDFTPGAGICFNDYEKRLLAENLVEDLIDANVLTEEQRESAFLKIWSSQSKLKSLTEFSRAVHAEMHAIISGSQSSGDRMLGGKLYCTTYPCHNCARHIIASGIMEVYYIEPYAKSLCLKLHPDAITEDETDKTKVRILMYEGVAPMRYLKFFSIIKDRKDSNGDSTRFSPDALKKAKPKTQLSLRALPMLEAQAIHVLKENELLININ